MNQTGYEFSAHCKKCDCDLEMDDYAIDHSCQGKHIFFFKCPKCDDFTATAMVNIPQEKWKNFIPVDKVDSVITEFEEARKRDH
jgi:hypothetical protein